MKISKIIHELEALKERHGDQEGYVGGGDYPDKVREVHVQEERDAYIPKGAIAIR